MSDVQDPRRGQDFAGETPEPLPWGGPGRDFVNRRRAWLHQLPAVLRQRGAASTDSL